MPKMRSALYAGKVMHQRLKPRRHRLSYRMFFLLLDLDEIDVLSKRLHLLSHNQFNLFGFADADYGDRAGGSLKAYVERQLDAAGIDSGGAIQLLSMPRMLGYAFNPLSLYFCHNRHGDLQALLYEVNNTFGQRHSYLIRRMTAPSGSIATNASTFRLSSQWEWAIASGSACRARASPSTSQAVMAKGR